MAKDRKPLPHFPLTASIRARARLKTKVVMSSNLVARLPGNDPQLKNEYVVLSAHIDHVGIGEPVNGDRIYNGAMDNAAGVAVLLDVAASLKKHPENLKRSLLFVFVTGEEKGLLGSKYFAAHPTVDPKSMVADINVDMFRPLVPLKLLTVLGLAESDLGDVARQVAESDGVSVQPDPQPLRNVFVRSDQYSFIRHGVPALAMDVAPSTPEQKQMFQDWLTKRYHAPSDDLDQPVDLAAAGKYEEIIQQLLVKVADDPQRPQWKADSFFRRYAETLRIKIRVVAGDSPAVGSCAGESPACHASGIRRQIFLHQGEQFIAQERPACQQAGEQRRLAVAKQLRTLQRADETTGAGDQGRAGRNVPFMFRGEREGDIRQARRNQRQFVGHRSHGTDFDRGGFESLPLPALDLASAGQDHRALKAGPLAGARRLSVVGDA